MGGAAVASRDCRWFRNRSYDGTYQGSHRDRYVARHDRSADLYRPHNPRPHDGPYDGTCAGNDRSRARSRDRCARSHHSCSDCHVPASAAGDRRRRCTDGTALSVLSGLEGLLTKSFFPMGEVTQPLVAAGCFVLCPYGLMTLASRGERDGVHVWRC